MTSATQPIVIYHSPCVDGFTAAWACWLLHPDWIFYPVVHGEPPPDCSGRDVYLLDFSYKLEDMRKLLREARNVMILDHHVTAEETVRILRGEGLRGQLDVKHSGAYLAWRFFHGKGEPPALVLYVEDRDLWRFALPQSREINSAIDSYDLSFEGWSRMAAEVCDTAAFARDGEAIKRKRDKDVRELVRATVMRARIGGYDVPIANLPHTFFSEVGHYLCAGEPFAACYFIDKSGQYVFGLRSAEDGIDVSEVAKWFGGGGHRNAAGFQLKSLDAFNLTKDQGGISRGSLPGFESQGSMFSNPLQGNHVAIVDKPVDPNCQIREVNDPESALSSEDYKKLREAEQEARFQMVRGMVKAKDKVALSYEVALSICTMTVCGLGIVLIIQQRLWLAAAFVLIALALRTARNAVRRRRMEGSK